MGECFKNFDLEKINVDATNSSKVTPLMLASYLNNFNMVNELLQANADILKEDSGGSTALCYAIAAVVRKHIEIPHLVINKLLNALEMVGVTFENFLQNHIDAILSCPVKQKKSGHIVLDAKDFIIPYALEHEPGSLKILLEEKTFKKIALAIEKYMDNPHHLTKYLTIVNKLLHSTDFWHDSLRKRVLLSYVSDGCADACLSILKKYEFENVGNVDLSMAFETLVLNCVSHETGQLWLSDNYDDMFLVYQKFLSKSTNKERSNFNNDDFLKFVDLIQIIKLNKTGVKNCPLMANDVAKGSESGREGRTEIKVTTKRSKRRSKALKAKISKNKSADFAKRLSQNGKEILEQKCVSDTSIVKKLNKSKKIDEKFINLKEKDVQWSKCSTWEQLWLMDSGNDSIIKEYNNTMVTLENKITQDLNNGFLNVGSGYAKELKDKPDSAVEYEKTSSIKDTKFGNYSDCTKETPYQDLTSMLQSTISYLSVLLNKILEKYEYHWFQDSQNEISSKNNMVTKTQNQQMPHIQNIIKKLEVEHLQRVQNEFDALITDIKNNAHKDIGQCTKVLERLENIFVNHKIRGKSIIDSIPVDALKDITYFLKNTTGYFQETKPSQPVDRLMYNMTMNSHDLSAIPKNHPDAMYLEEVLSLPEVKPINLSQLITAQENTMKCAYHLWSSFNTICDDSDNTIKSDDGREGYECAREDVPSTNKKRLSFQDNLKSIQNQRISDEYKNLFDVKSNAKSDEDNLRQFPSRWYNIIKSLQTDNNYHVLLNGDVRISGTDKDLHIISSGGNFSTVVLGLDSNDQPLAVKRIKAHADVSKLMKDLINPLLGLRNANLLHYFTCNFENNELVVATPLCEYNMGEYVMFMKQHNNMVIRSFDVVKQFLSGLRFLHNRKEPIIHGNLKPSNIFLDLNGTVRIAEFGMHKVGNCFMKYC
ncbi:hypothetical protein FQR65_LT02688 [Abscondita terminalis]|nr:hypothetical protein FQR65_LT02688 [Abscondita terminalis]